MSERITFKTFMGDYALDCESEKEWEKTKNKAFNKLGQLEDIEEELGVDLITLFKALSIIKEKRVNLEYIKCCENYEQYKTVCSYWNELTEQEFDLLKEVLC